jgi:DNA-binding transcriptional MocR family regulator
MRYANIRYSTLLNEAQYDYLSDECQDISRMKCFKTFIRLTLMEQTTVTKTHFSAVLQPGQFMASKVELSQMWGCNRKTATRIIREFNQMGILRSEPSNRTTIHTLLCLSVWFTDQRTIKNSFFVSNPMVKPIEKPRRPTNHVPPKSGAETVEVCKPTPTDSGGTSSADTGNVTKVISSQSLAEVKEEHSLTPSLSLPSNDNLRERVSPVCQSSSGTVADNRHYPTSSNLLSDDMQERNIQPTAEEEPQQPSCHKDESLLPEVSTEGKGIEA